MVWCNPAFSRLTGYQPDEIIGRNCRLLQGDNTDPGAVGRIRHSLTEPRSVTELLLNYRKDGTAFWNQVRISPVRDEGGHLVNFVGVLLDVTERCSCSTNGRLRWPRPRRPGRGSGCSPRPVAG